MTLARRRLARILLAAAVCVAAGGWGCGGSSPEPPVSTPATSTDAAAQRARATAYLAALAVLAERDAAASTRLNRMAIDWDAPATWGPAIAAAEELRRETAAIRAHLAEVTPPPGFALVHRRLREVYETSLTLVDTLLHGLRARQASPSIYLEIQPLAERQFRTNAAFRAALVRAAAHAGVRVPPRLFLAYPTPTPSAS